MVLEDYTWKLRLVHKASLVCGDSLLVDDFGRCPSEGLLLNWMLPMTRCSHGMP